MRDPSSADIPPTCAPSDTPQVPGETLGRSLMELAGQVSDLSITEQASLLRADQCKRWQRGEHPPVEMYLHLLPGLESQADALLDLIYNEVVLREGAGETPRLEEYLERFPQHAEALQRQFALHQILEGDSLLGSAPPTRDEPAGPEPTDPYATQDLDTPPATQSYTPDAAPQQNRPPKRKPVAGAPQVPGYEVLRVLGRGGMGVVYQARQVRADRLVALKMILSGAHAGEQQLSRFRTEAEAAARLQHPNIAQVYEVGEHDGLPFFSLEFVEGGSLDKVLGGNPQLPGEAAALLEKVARAMHAAHEKGVLHRDLKPANILLTRSPGVPPGGDTTQAGHLRYEPKITDFGLAKKLDDDSGQTHTGDVMGTPSYMAPEQATGNVQDFGPHTDVYALGAILYEMLTGRPPFKGASLHETLEQVRSQEPVPPSRLQPKCPSDLETICLKCLRKEPARRYATAQELADDLHRFLNDEPILARPVGRLERGVKWVRRHPTLTALWVLGTAACVGVMGGVILWHHLSLRAEVSVARANVAQAKAEVAEARAAEQQAKEERRIAQDREKAQESLAFCREALNPEHEDLEKAKQELSKALTLTREPALADLNTAAEGLQYVVNHRVEARSNYARLSTLHDEALFHLDWQLFTGLELRESLDLALKDTQEALQLFGVALDSRKELVLDDLYSAQQKEEIRKSCFEMLVIRAKALTHPLLPAGEEERRRHAREALTLLARADTLLPGTRISHRLRARYLDLLGDKEAAEGERRVADAPGPSTPLDSFLVGHDKWFAEGNVREARLDFERAAGKQNNLFWAHFFRALACQRLGDLSEARASLTICAGQQPEFVWNYLLRGFLSGELAARAEGREAEVDLENAQADLDRAEELLTKAGEGKATEPARYVLHVNRGVLRLRQKRYDEAIAELQKAIQLRPKQYHAYVDLAEVYRQRKEPERALELLGQALELDQANGTPSEQAELYRLRARLQLQRQELDGAMSDLGEAIRLQGAEKQSPTLAEDYLECGVIDYRERKYAETVSACEKALTLQPDLVVAYRLKGMALMRQASYREAASAFDQYIARGKPVVDVFRAHARASAELGDHAAAVADYTRALALQPDDSRLHAARGWAYLGSEAPRLALPDFEKAVRLDPQNGDAYNGRGYAAVKGAASRGALAKAVADADTAVRLGARDQRTLYNAARIYAQAVGKLDSDEIPEGRQLLETRSLYQDRALAYLRTALEVGQGPERVSFWQQQVQHDAALSPIRSSPGFKQLAAAYETR